MWNGNLPIFDGQGHVEAPFLISLMSEFCCRLWPTLYSTSAMPEGNCNVNRSLNYLDIVYMHSGLGIVVESLVIWEDLIDSV